MPASFSVANRLAVRLVGIALLALMAFMGTGAVWNGIRLLHEGNPNTVGASVAVVMGAILVAVAAYLAWWSFLGAAAAAARRKAIRARYPGQPWMERSDWANRRIVHSVATPALLSWVWVLGWCGGLALIGTVNKAKIATELTTTWSAWVVLVIFALGTLVGLTITWNFTMHWLRYGRSSLTLDTLPGRPGQLFRATLSAALPRGDRPNVDVNLVCEDVRWVTTGYGKQRRTRLHVDRLGAVSSQIPGQRGASTAKGFVVPIEIQIPENLPDSGKDESGNGVQWRLEVATAGGFAATFEVPIYGDGARAEPA